MNGVHNDFRWVVNIVLISGYKQQTPRTTLPVCGFDYAPHPSAVSVPYPAREHKLSSPHYPPPARTLIKMDIEALKEQVLLLFRNLPNSYNNMRLVERGRGSRWIEAKLECVSQLSNGIPILRLT